MGVNRTCHARDHVSLLITVQRGRPVTSLVANAAGIDGTALRRIRAGFAILVPDKKNAATCWCEE